MRPIPTVLVALMGLLLLLLWSEQRRWRRIFLTEAQLRAKAAAAEKDSADNLRLLRAAGAELREQALALLGQTECTLTAHGPEWSAIAARLLAMADDMQDHAPPSPESRTLVRESLLLGPLVEQCVAAVSATLMPGSRTWRIAPGLREQRVNADQRALTQVLLRVLSNAARATRQQDWIEVGFEQRGAQVIITVEDEGSGLLLTAPEAPAREGRGFGFGLAVARSLMLAHGGSLMIESVPGVGARVEIALPQLRRS